MSKILNPDLLNQADLELEMARVDLIGIKLTLAEVQQILDVTEITS